MGVWSWWNLCIFIHLLLYNTKYRAKKLNRKGNEAVVYRNVDGFLLL